jgi:hemerythrin-like domain-containing protein
MMTVELWTREQSDVGQLLAMLRREADAPARGEESDYALMQEIVSCLILYTDRLHHPTQAVAFERMRRRDPTLTTVMNRLSQEHLMIAASAAELLERLREVGADALMPRGVVEEAAGTYLAYFGHHIAVEERELLPRVARLLDEDDWRAIESVVKGDHGPPTPEEVISSLRSLRLRHPSEAASTAAAGAAPGPRKGPAAEPVQ